LCDSYKAVTHTHISEINYCIKTFY